MMETFLQTVFSNLLFALILAGVAWGTERFLRKPLLAHLLWVAVFIKLLSPPIISFSLPEIAFAPSFLIEKETISTSSGGGIFLITECLKYCGWEILFILWAGGSFLILGNCLRKIIHFNRLLCSGAGSPSQEIVKLAEELTSKLNLKRVPLLQITSAKISPMVWWIGGRIRIILPRVLLEKFPHEGIRWVLAHELTHVARRDYLIRWLEFLSSVIFWWNPLICWVKNHLRQNEEICCDDQVIEIFAVNRRKYAETLLDAVELLSPMPGDLVVDVAACPGGKSVGAAIAMNNSGKILSFDIHPNKLPLITRTAARMGVDIIETGVRDGRTPAGELAGKADRVICDVPCSALGLINSKPGVRLKDAEAFASLPQLQYTMLENACEMLRPGGRVVYSTCTFNRDENEGVTSPLLSQHRDMVKISDRLFMTYRDGTEGFYVCCMEKRKDG